MHATLPVEFAGSVLLTEKKKQAGIRRLKVPASTDFAGPYIVDWFG
jgi:hypothetical protein